MASYRMSATEFLSSGTKVEDYARALLDRIAARDVQVQAWAYLDPEFVLSQARKLDAIPQEQRGPLHGVPIGVKDIFYTKDMPTQHNSPIYANDAPVVDAALIMMLRTAGALIFGPPSHRVYVHVFQPFSGKTTTTQFASITVGTKTMNPHNPARTPGGSSSGSGAAVADFQVPVALGTQTIGSIIRPASFCGIYSFKPTWGALPREGVKVCSLNFDTMGFFARSIADIELLADAARLEDDEKPIAPFKIEGAKFAACKTHVWPEVGPGTINAMQLAVKLLRDQGASVEELDLPGEFASVTRSHLQAFQQDAATTFKSEYIRSKDQLDPALVAFVENPEKTSHRDHLAALDNLAQLRPKIDIIASRYDAIITPSVVDEAPEGLTSTGNPALCGMWTALHVPVVNVPGFAGDHGMPVGLSLVAPRYHDRRLLSVAAAVAPVFEGGGWKSSL
ncbi:amidase signature domain-containing protein [Mycena alexandri]|uniref:Amidase signature domain-containing protein n=1 Tax=Mycena alexandri TaxID=1745969 RepID=A0AAD6WV30_9AGAR|nr:amidase signature domain-containing protein [Mycena alexandri]